MTESAIAKLSRLVAEEAEAEKRKNGEKTEIDRALAKYYCDNNEYEKGLKLYKEIVQAEDNEEDIKKFIDYTVKYSAGFFRSREWNKILELYKDLLKYDKKVPDNFYKNIGLCLTSMGSHESAIKFLKVYQKKFPKDSQVYLLIGEILFEKLNKFEEAIGYYERALSLGDKSFIVYNTLGHLYSKVYRDSRKEEQINYLEKAYAIDPKNRIVVKNLAYVYGKFDEIEKADRMWKELLSLNPLYTDLHSYGAYLVKHGRFREGFDYLRNRFQKEDLPGPAFANIMQYKDKMWKIEESLAGKKVLIHYEQGFGDTIMFIRYVNQLKDRCKDVVVIAQDTLIPLLRDSNIQVPVRSRFEIKDINFDVLIPMMDLPLICGTTKDTIPYSEGYLNVPNELVEEYRKNYIESNNKLKIGFAFEGAEASLETKRDIPLEYFYRFMRMENVDMYCFQVGDLFKQLDRVPSDCKFKKLGSTFRTWEDTACAMKCMDLIITSDNGILNLAGALGVKTFGVFNSMSEWRWIDTKGEDVKWYKSVKPFSCDISNNWTYAMNNVAEEVKKLL